MYTGSTSAKERTSFSSSNWTDRCCLS